MGSFAVSMHTGVGIGLVATALAFGFRHGIDWDHLAALTDITGSQDHARRSMAMATLYALGHALVVFTLGVVAIVLSAELPAWVDGTMERVVGVTLLMLGFYVIVSLVRNGRDFRMRSRWMLVFAGVKKGARWLRGRRTSDELIIVHEHDHAHGADHPHEHNDEIATERDAAAVAVATRHRHVTRTPDRCPTTRSRPTGVAPPSASGCSTASAPRPRRRCSCSRRRPARAELSAACSCS